MNDTGSPLKACLTALTLLQTCTTAVATDMQQQTKNEWALLCFEQLAAYNWILGLLISIGRSLAPSPSL